MKVRWLLPLLLTAACAEAEPMGNEPLETDYLMATREPTPDLTCEAIEGSPGVAVIVAAYTDLETDAVTHRYAQLASDDVAEACTRCGAKYRLATTKQVASVRDGAGTSLTKDGFTFRGGKRARAASSRFWVSTEAFTDAFPSKKTADDDDMKHAVMCLKTK